MTSSRTNIAFAALAAVCAVFDAACSPAPRPPAFAADTVLTNGTVLTVDAHDAVAQALAIKNGRIVFVGTSADAEAYVGPSTQRIDLAGMTATPGLIDAHAHFANGGGELNRVIDVSYPAVKSAADIAQKVRERAATTPPGEWILGRGWDEGKLDGHRYVYGEDLDEVSPEHPV
ncbi:MAG: amidohydrolase family protein, partial [Vicinamibacterales bacterium]